MMNQWISGRPINKPYSTFVIPSVITHLLLLQSAKTYVDGWVHLGPSSASCYVPNHYGIWQSDTTRLGIPGRAGTCHFDLPSDPSDLLDLLDEFKIHIDHSIQSKGVNRIVLITVGALGEIMDSISIRDPHPAEIAVLYQASDEFQHLLLNEGMAVIEISERTQISLDLWASTRIFVQGNHPCRGQVDSSPKII